VCRSVQRWNRVSSTDPGLTDPYRPGWPGNVHVYAPVNIIYSNFNLAPRPRSYNLSLMNIVEVSAGFISPVYWLCIQHSKGFAIRHEATTIETFDSLPVPLEQNALTVTVHQYRQKVHFCSAESGSKDRVMCIGHWPVTRPGPKCWPGRPGSISGSALMKSRFLRIMRKCERLTQNGDV